MTAPRIRIREAATVVLVRDAPTLEVFMIRRNLNAVFVPGAYVFPGGGVDRDDHDVPIEGRVVSDADRLLARSGARRWWSAAARETFEEAGFLLTSPGPDHAYEAARVACNSGALAWSKFLHDNGFTVAGDALHPIAHWRTPIGAPRRYDTWFFLAQAPADQEGVHDDEEAVHSEWVTPSALLERWRAGAVELILPTTRVLVMLEAFASAAQLLRAVEASADEARAARRAPLVVRDGSGDRIAILEHDLATAAPGWRQLRPDVASDRALDALSRGGQETRGAPLCR